MAGGGPRQRVRACVLAGRRGTARLATGADHPGDHRAQDLSPARSSRHLTSRPAGRRLDPASRAARPTAGHTGTVELISASAYRPLSAYWPIGATIGRR